MFNNVVKWVNPGLLLLILFVLNTIKPEILKISAGSELGSSKYNVEHADHLTKALFAMFMNK